MKHENSVSIIIPVYNEEESLGACLKAIEAQTVKPLEVIVVDNNSTDNTVAVARQFSFVRLISEPRQGVVYARATGFDAARGDIIGRIDGDTILPSSWVQKVQHIFSSSTVDAVSGQPHYYDFPFPRLADAIDSACRRWLSRVMEGELYLYGANMAMRRNAWRQTREQLCAQNHMHEDFDLAIHLQQAGFKVAYNEQLIASVCSRRIDVNLMSYVRYTLVSPNTYKMHKLTSGRHMYRVVLVCWLCYVPGRLMYRSFNRETGKFSLSLLFAPANPRVDPTTNVI